MKTLSFLVLLCYSLYANSASLVSQFLLQQAIDGTSQQKQRALTTTPCFSAELPDHGFWSDFAPNLRLFLDSLTQIQQQVFTSKDTRKLLNQLQSAEFSSTPLSSIPSIRNDSSAHIILFRFKLNSLHRNYSFDCLESSIESKSYVLIGVIPTLLETMRTIHYHKIELDSKSQGTLFFGQNANQDSLVDSALRPTPWYTPGELWIEFRENGNSSFNGVFQMEDLIELQKDAPPSTDSISEKQRQIILDGFRKRSGM